MNILATIHASTEVARVLEGITQLAAQRAPAPRTVTGPRDADLRMARTCYDHIAGRLGVAITQHLLDNDAIAFDGKAGHVTDRAAAVLIRVRCRSAPRAWWPCAMAWALRAGTRWRRGAEDQSKSNSSPRKPSRFFLR